jgi:hypothetical protein
MRIATTKKVKGGGRSGSVSFEAPPRENGDSGEREDGGGDDDEHHGAQEELSSRHKALLLKATPIFGDVVKSDAAKISVRLVFSLHPPPSNRMMQQRSQSGQHPPPPPLADLITGLTSTRSEWRLETG